MYIIKYKNQSEAIFVSPSNAPQGLSPQDYFPEFNHNTMEWGWTDQTPPPRHFKINPENQVVELTLAEKVSQKLVALSPEEKIVDGKIVVKTPEEQLADGILFLAPNQKIVNNEIVEKSLEEQVADGLLILPKDQKLENGQIVPLTPAEQVAKNLIELDEPWEYVDGDDIAYRTLEEVVNGNLLSSEDVERAMEMLYEEIDEAILYAYSSGYESKITKNYLKWLNEGKPADDDREAKFVQMEADIEAIKASFKPMKDKIKALLP